MKLSDFKFVKLDKDTVIPTFNCKDEDLTSFLNDDAKNYVQELMATTYLFVDTQHNAVVAYFSLLNDKVAYNPQDKSIWNRINRLIQNKKRRKSYPSAKIGRLAVADKYCHNGLGSDILQFIKWSIVKDFKMGCRFLTVDAYAAAVDFYKKNGFNFFTMTDALDATRLMYFDLKPFNEQLQR
ncbi:MAG: GNAT family N-acetyltransferase [Paludibacteraceae bacterium]|nr:GNAT family N-acetyltransferase [Paludibacteraceae bacterium]